MAQIWTQSEFSALDTISLARNLLGQDLVARTATGEILRGMIVETEAYLGLQDSSCHSFHGKRTARVSTMYGPAGTSYVYLIYGIYHCFNIVAGTSSEPEAVLIRALKPEKGLSYMRRQRPGQLDAHLCNGPGKLCQAWGINSTHNGLPLWQASSLWIEHSESPKTQFAVIEGERVGLNPNRDSAYWPLRFGIEDSPWLSPAPWK